MSWNEYEMEVNASIQPRPNDNSVTVRFTILLNDFGTSCVTKVTTSKVSSHDVYWGHKIDKRKTSISFVNFAALTFFVLFSYLYR